MWRPRSVTACLGERQLQQQIGDRLALAILEGTFVEGDTITVDVDGSEDVVLRRA